MPVIAKQQSAQHLNADVETVSDIALFERLSAVEKNRKIRNFSGFFYFRL